MAKCRLCKKNISDGIEYCEDCLDKKQVQTDESYLDSLLNSVKNSAEPIENIYRKPQELRIAEPVKAYNKGKDIRPGQIDPADLADFDQFNIHEDLDDLIVISDEELYGSSEEFLGEELTPSMKEAAQKEQDKEIHKAPSQEMDTLNQSYEELLQGLDLDHLESNKHSQDEEIGNRESGKLPQDGDLGYLEPEMLRQDMDLDYIGMDDFQQGSNIDRTGTGDSPQDADIDESMQFIASHESGSYGTQPEALETDASLQGIQDNIDLDFLDQFSNPAMEELEDESYDPSLGELLSGFGFSEEENDSDEDLLEPMNGDRDFNSSDTTSQEVAAQTEEEEFLSLLGQFGEDDPVAADVRAITELLNNPVDKSKSVSMPSDVGEVFSDALKAVSGLDDLEDADQSYSIPEQPEPTPKGKAKKSKGKEKGTTGNKKEKAAKSKATKGKGLFGKLFGNVVDEKSIKEAKQSKASEESATTKEKKKAKGKKGKKNTPENIEEVKDAPRRAVPGEEQQEAPKAKKEKKPKKPKKEKKVIELIDDYEEIEGRINKLGATVVFTFFGIMVALLLIGTSIFIYSVSIKNAKTYFDRQKYTEAYNEVYGMELRDEDIELYERIMTVMFVNKQLNSYNNYYAMKRYPEALDSLIKGLKRYDKYIELATMLGIKTDLDYVRDQIMGELEHVYLLSEEDIDEILSINNQREYSIAVYNAVIENMKY